MLRSAETRCIGVLPLSFLLSRHLGYEAHINNTCSPVRQAASAHTAASGTLPRCSNFYLFVKALRIWGTHIQPLQPT